MSSSRDDNSRGLSRGDNSQGLSRGGTSQVSSQGSQSIMGSGVASGNSAGNSTVFTPTKEWYWEHIKWLDVLIEEAGRELVEGRGVDPRTAKGMKVTVSEGQRLAKLEWYVNNPKTHSRDWYPPVYGPTCEETLDFEVKTRVLLFGRLKELVKEGKMERRG